MTTTITVVHLITQLELGGAQENTLATVAGLDRGRFAVGLWRGPGGLLEAEAELIGEIEHRVMPELVREISPAKDSGALATLIRELRLARRRHQARGGDPRAFILHTHSSKAGILGRAAGRAAGVPVVVHSIHGFGFHEGQNPLVRAAFVNAERAASRLTDAFISVSRANLAEAMALGIVSPTQRAVVIRSGFDLRAFRAEAERGPALRAELGLGPDDEVFVAIANLKPQKDPITLLRAFAELSRSRPRAVLLYVGDGELRPQLEAEIARLGVGDRFRLLGWRRDVGALMGTADVVVLSSIFEGLPRSAVQAIAVRRPFVGTRVDGTGEVIRAGKNGFLVEPRDPPALAAAMARAIVERPVDPDDAARTEAWDVRRMVDAQAELYEALTARPACSSG